ncbi:MAG TPA: hypothetical protein VN622_05165 [Clostridia bacterium]|nr:hypothetical protein [Clostridia bacterium]
MIEVTLAFRVAVLAGRLRVPVLRAERLDAERELAERVPARD